MDEDLIGQFRLLTGITEQDINDDDLWLVLEANDGDINLSAAVFYDRLAAQYSRLVDVSESGSSRSLGSLYKNANTIADSYRTKAKGSTTTSTSSGSARTRQITRVEA